MINVLQRKIKISIEKNPNMLAAGPQKNKLERLKLQYLLSKTIVEAPGKIAPLKLEAGCFVLLSNLIDQQDWPAPELLTLYKS